MEPSDENDMMRELHESGHIEEEDEEENGRFPVSHAVPPVLLGLEYKNPPQVGFSSGFPTVITFEIHPDDTEQPWYHERLNRDAANSLLKSRSPGTFLLRPSSRPRCTAVSYVSSSQDIQHEVIYTTHAGYARSENPASAHEIFSSLREFVAKNQYLRIPLEEGECPTDTGRFLQRTSEELVRTLIDLLNADAEELVSLRWELHESRHASRVDRRTNVRYCHVNYVAPDFLPLQGAVGCTIFAALQHNSTLREITSHCCGGLDLVNITDEEVKVLALSLRKNSTLTKIDLSYNHITDVGALHLARALVTNRTVQHLNLDGNYIHVRGMRALCQLLAHNDRINILSVKNQRVYDRLRGQSLYMDSYHVFLCKLVTSALARKKELQSQSQFRGFLHRDQVQQLLENQKQGSFLFYLNCNNTGVVFLAFKAPTKIWHIPLYRGKYGYVPDVSGFVTPSLVDHCLWKLCGDPSLRDQLQAVQDWDHKVLSDRLHHVRALHILWGLTHIPDRRPLNLSGSSDNSSSPLVYFTLAEAVEDGRKLFSYVAAKRNPPTSPTFKK